MKKAFLLIPFFLFSLLAGAQPKAKYVFYFIGDGMGVNQVNGAETYLAALQGRIGVRPLCFTQFPGLGLVTTYSATNGVTDSAASGTALASGNKTKNHAVGVLKDLKTPVYSVAEHARRHGAAVGVSTSVSIDHATPAVFYAHAAHRKEYYKIGKQLTQSGFDYFGGSDFLEPLPKDQVKQANGQLQMPFDGKAGGKDNLYRMAEENGYTIARGYPQFLKKEKKADKMILLQPLKDSQYYRNTIPYKIDRKPDNLSLQQITRAGIDFLMKKQMPGKDQKQGFFLMVEGGMIDMACHSNDAGTYIRELVDMDSCIQIAYDFYRQHPDSTLIVVTADHETGGLSLGRGPYELNLAVLQHQKMSFYEYTKYLSRLRKSLGKAFTWEVVKADLQKNFGFWAAIPLTSSQEERLKKAYDAIVQGTAQDKKSMYAVEDALSYTASQIMDEVSRVGWQSNGHSNGFVGVYAIGAGSELFHGQMDNTDIPKKIKQAAGWE